jgi:hypothetical protein
MDRSARLRFVGLWLLIGAIAAGACALKWPAAHFGPEVVPVGNDSFYHARRILDTVADPASFYEFDPKIHAPEGSLLVWPWGYDYAMAWLVKAAQALGVPGSPMAILAWIPVLGVFAPIGLMMLICRRIGLSEGPTILAALAVALSPLTQWLNGVGIIDHHWAEYVFVLATLASGLKWLSKPDDGRAAITLGIVLGVAPAIHNGIFILQVPVLATLFVFWLQDQRVPLRSTLLFAAALLATTLAILIPSQPFRLGLFEYYRLSWFHLYIAVGTAVVSIALARLPRDKRGFAALLAMGVILVLPLVRQIAMVEGFLTAKISRLDAIMEMRALPPFAMTWTGAVSLVESYSVLVFLTPLTALYCAWQGWQERATGRVFLWICCLLGLALLVSQIRMHYYGSFALYLPWLVLLQDLLQRREQQRKLILLATSLLFALIYALPARNLAKFGDVANDSSFRVLRPILDDLRKACAQDPGIVLTDNDAGQYVRYYTDCSVIANNFLLTRQQEQKIRQIDYLTSIPANAFPGVAPFVRYILIRPATIADVAQKGVTAITYVSYSPKKAQLISDLLLKPLDQIPSSYVLLEQANIRDTSKDGVLPYIRLFKVNPVAPAAQASSLNPVDQ